MRLKQAGHSVALLEARDRVGGCTFTVVRDDGVWIDRNGHHRRVHGRPTSRGLVCDRRRPESHAPPGVLTEFGPALREPCGWVDGAVRSGERAASEVMEREQVAVGL